MALRKTLYVSDLDGTLLNRQSKVSERSAEILHKLIKEEGIMFTVATARTPATVESLVADIGIELPMIVMTGAAWWEPVGQRFVHERTLPVEVVRQINAICERHGINPFVYCVQPNHDFIRVEHVQQLSQQEFDFVNARVNLPHKAFYLNDDVAPAEAYLVFACNNYELLRRVNSEINANVDCTATCYPDIFDNTVGFLEIFAPHTSKAAAIKQLAAEVEAEKIVVFGDNLNDIPMLGIADTAVAVGNAFEEVKQAADIVIDNNDTDAVARWIRDNHTLLP